MCTNAHVQWDDLRYVLAIARDGTLLRAAQILGVAHTTVGRRLLRLEDELGVRLFDRTPEGYVPTAAGEDLAEVAERMESDVLAVEGRVLGRDAHLRGRLRVSTGDLFFHVFARDFVAFKERYPSVDLTVHATSDPVSLTRREADVVLRLSDAPPDNLVGRDLGFVQFGVYASPGLIDAAGEDAPLSDYPWIGWDERLDRRWFDAWLADNAPGADIVLRLSHDFRLMAQAIRSDIGVQILPCFFADPDPTLHRIAPLEEMFRLRLWLLTLPELRTNSRVRVFMTHMADALAAHRPALAGDPTTARPSSTR